MTQPTSQNFLNAQYAPSNFVSSKVQLILGNYFNAAAYGTTVTSNGDDASGNYPASGAIDGDRTEINIGAAASADDNIGQSSWRSASIPSIGSPSQIVISFTQARTINRIKLYHLAGHGLSNFVISYWDGSAWIPFVCTNNNVVAPNVIITTGTLDIIDFPDITTTKILFNVYATAVGGDKANIVEIEAYRKIDITSRIKAIKPSRNRDYKMVNPMAATMQLDCINTDRYFSVSHIPTTAEIASGFVNQELRPGIGMVVQIGFNYYGAAPELVTTFTGEIDSITISPKSRDAIIEHRDVLKKVINHQVDSSKLKTNIDISDAIRYILNRTNISNYEMNLDNTGILLPYFFTDQEAALDTIQDLAQAAGDTAFFIDELGIPTFKDYSSNLPNQQVLDGEAYFESGQLSNIATQGAYVGELAVPPQFIPLLTDGTLSGNMEIAGGNLTLPAFSQAEGQVSPAFLKLGNNLFDIGDAIWQRFAVPQSGVINSVTVGPFTKGGAGSNYTVQIMGDSGGFPDQSNVLWSSGSITTNYGSQITLFPNVHIAAQTVYIEIISTNSFTFLQGSTHIGFADLAIFLNSDGVRWQTLVTNTGAGMAMTCSFTFTSDTGTWTSPWYDSGSLAVNLAPTLFDSASYPSGTAATFTINGSNDGSTIAASYTTTNITSSHVYSIAQYRYWNIVVVITTASGILIPTIGPPSLLFASSGTWISPIIDTGSETTGYGSITDDEVPNGGTISYSTQSSADGVTWNSFVPVSVSGQILSPVLRYLRVMVVMTLGPGGVTPLILDITVSWLAGAGSIKYPTTSSFTFAFNSMMLDCQQQLADNLGGDSSILNDIIVQAEPLVLTGGTPTDLPGLTNIVWQGTIGIPPVNVTPTTPLTVTAGQILTFTPYISGGMDITYMSGANPAAAVVTFADGAAGTWLFTNIHPTLPVLQITITVSGQISGLTINGLNFSNADYLQVQEVFDPVSIALYDRRQDTIDNPWITSTSAAAAIGAIILNNFRNPVAYLPSCKVGLCPSIQLGDRVTVVDVNLDLSADYICVGAAHTIDNKSGTKASIESDLTLIAIPAGS